MVATIIILCLYAMNLGISLIMHGKPKDEKYNFWTTLLATGVSVALLWWAGIFENFK